MINVRLKLTTTNGLVVKNVGTGRAQKVFLINISPQIMRQLKTAIIINVNFAHLKLSTKRPSPHIANQNKPIRPVCGSNVTSARINPTTNRI
jgi:hypothetical protein